MQYLGDFATGSTVRGAFNTRKADGTPITLAGTPALSVYKDGNTTETTTGVTLTVDFDSRTGHHLFAIDTSNAFYTSGSDFRVVITTGTVDSVSVVGVQVGSFSLANRSALRPTTAGRTLDVTSGGAAGIDWGNIENEGTIVSLSNTVVWRASWLDNISADLLVANGLILAQGYVVASTSTTVDLSWLTQEPSLDLVGALAILTYDDDGARKGQTRMITNVALVNGVPRLTVDRPWSINPSSNIPDTITIIPAGPFVRPTTFDRTLGVDASGQVTVGSMAANTVTASALATDAVNEIVDQVWDEASNQHTSSGSFGNLLAAIDNNVGEVNDNVDLIKPVTDKLDTALEADGGVYRFTANALEQAPGNAQQSTLLQIKAKTDLITSTTNFVTVERVAGATITMYFSEATTATVGLDEDTSSLTLRFVVENSDQLDVLVIENANITRTASNFTVTITTAVTATLGQYRWALRDITGGVNRLIEGGVLQVVGAANKDA